MNQDLESVRALHNSDNPTLLAPHMGLHGGLPAVGTNRPHPASLSIGGDHPVDESIGCRRLGFQRRHRGVSE